MTAPLLYSMLKSKSTHPLHEAIRLRREDVVLLYMIEFNQEVGIKTTSRFSGFQFVSSHASIHLESGLKGHFLNPVLKAPPNPVNWIDLWCLFVVKDSSN